MNIFIGYTRHGNAKTLELTGDGKTVIYAIDNVVVNTFDYGKNAVDLIKELNNVVMTSYVDKKYIDKIIEYAENDGISFKDIHAFYDALLQMHHKRIMFDQNLEEELQQDEYQQEKDVTLNNDQQNKKATEQEQEKRNKLEELFDLRLHMDDALNAFIGANDLDNADWFSWEEALYASSNYLETYAGPINTPLPSAIVRETCDDTVNNQYKEYLESLEMTKGVNL